MSRLSSTAWNERHTKLVAQFHTMVDHLVKELLADGAPPFSEPLPVVEQYARLVALKQAGHPSFWNDPVAQQTLAQLEPQFAPGATLPYATTEYML